jgi:hypothetical protein
MRVRTGFVKSRLNNTPASTIKFFSYFFRKYWKSTIVGSENINIQHFFQSVKLQIVSVTFLMCWLGIWYKLFDSFLLLLRSWSFWTKRRGLPSITLCIKSIEFYYTRPPKAYIAAGLLCDSYLLSSCATL